MYCPPHEVDYVHSISGQDYPIVNNEEFDKFFDEHNGESFMLYDKPSEHMKWSRPRGKYEQRYMRYYFIDNNFPKLLEKIIHGLEHVHFVRRPIKEVYAGWSWFSWHHKVVEFVLGYLKEHPEYLYRFHNTSCCDEIIFHTLLHPYLRSLKIDSNNALRYIVWHPNRPYEGRLPLILDERDYNSVLCSGALFCRKVDEKHSGKLLDMLDKLIVKEF